MQRYLKIYVNFLKKFIEIKKPIRIVFDCSNGTTGIILERLKITIRQRSVFSGRNLKLKIINAKPDGRFPAHGPNPLLPGALKQLSREMQKFNADLGAAFDADGDRVVFLDNKRRPIPSYLIAHTLNSNGKFSLVLDVPTFLAFLGVGFKAKKVFISRVGTFFMRKMLREKMVAIGAEYSGHYYFKEFFYADSGIFAAIKVLNAVSRLPYSLADYHDLAIQNYFVKQFDIKSKNPEKVLKMLEKKFKKLAVRTIKVDGLAFIMQDGWILARSSNTEPILRFFIGGSKDFVFANKRAISKILKST